MTHRESFREDVQALRGIAVLLVVLCHAKISGLAAGYLGVDIFFVISGYLIIGLVARRMAEGRFSFAEFYLNRAKRLLPAAYVVYATTAVAAYWFLTDSEFDRLLNTLWGALSFTANFGLWLNTNYFGTAAKFNALLHVWSLSVEEQFYLVLPLVLFLAPRRYRLAGVMVGGIASLALCLYLAPRSPVAAFYLLPTRGWELALGGVVALIEGRLTAASGGAAKLDLKLFRRFFSGDATRNVTSYSRPSGTVLAFAATTWTGAWLTLQRHSGRISAAAASGLAHPKVAVVQPSVWLGVPALSALVLTPAFGPGSLLGSIHPGLDSILVCVATALLILCQFSLLARGPIAWALARLGDMSYSLYLIHWPLFTFATNLYLGEPPPLHLRLLLFAASIGLAAASFRFIEEPIRRHSIGNLRVRPAFAVMAATAAVVTIAIGARSTRPPSIFHDRSIDQGLDASCDFNGNFEPLRACVSLGGASTLVWGDSYAMHLVPGLVEHVPKGLVQATKSVCGPIMGVAAFDTAIGFSDEWAKTCLSFNSSVFAFLSRHHEINLVVLSSVFSQYVEPGAFGLVQYGGETRAQPLEYDLVAARFEATIKHIQALGKRVVVVGPTPVKGFDIGLCYERRLSGLVTLGPDRDCQVGLDRARAYRRRELRLLRDVSATTSATVVDLADYLCNQARCRTEIGNVPIYRDGGHFSVIGSRRMMATTKIASAIVNSGR